MIAARRSSDYDTEFLDEDREVFPLPNVRRRRQNDDQARLLSQSAFNRITETLGALNAVGKFFLNMTREVNGDHQQQNDDMQLISSSSSVQVESTKKPSIDKTSFFSNNLSTTTHKTVSTNAHKMTNKTVEPLIKRIGLSEVPEKGSKIDEQVLNEKIDMAALAEKKRNKHQATISKKEIISTHTTQSTTIAPGNFNNFMKTIDKQWNTII